MGSNTRLVTYWEYNLGKSLQHAVEEKKQPWQIRVWECLAHGGGTIRRCGLVGRSASPSPWRQALRSHICSNSAQCGRNTGSSWLPSDQDIELLTLSPAACLSTCRHVAHHDDNGPNWTTETVSQPQLNLFLYKSRHGHSVSSQQQNP